MLSVGSVLVRVPNRKASPGYLLNPLAVCDFLERLVLSAFSGPTFDDLSTIGKVSIVAARGHSSPSSTSFPSSHSMRCKTISGYYDRRKLAS